MSYYTEYSAEIDTRELTTPTDAQIEQINKAYKEVSEVSGGLVDEEGCCEDSGKWYDHEVDVAAISKKYPTLIFELQGHGEEVEDLWIKYFLNGKMQESRAQITFEPFSESLLKEVSA